MFPRASLLALALALAASARMERHAHVRRDNPPSDTRCSTGNIQCCNSVTRASDITSFLDMLSYSYDPADSIGIDCTPFNIYGFGQGATCEAQPVCCSNNTQNGYINVGCSPFNLN